MIMQDITAVLTNQASLVDIMVTGDGHCCRRACIWFANRHFLRLEFKGIFRASLVV
jgi:hypothetical protein